MRTNTEPRTLLRRAVVRVGKRARPWSNDLIARHSRVGDQPVFDPSLFPWTAGLEAGWEAVRDEARAALAKRDEVPPLREISSDHQRIAPEDSWKALFLYGYGHRREQACTRCPETARLVESVPGLESAFFSLLEPGSRLPSHNGPTKAILTCHLPLWVPADESVCYIKIDGLRFHWKPGRVLIFDDTYRHKVRNKTDEERLVLLLHFRRPVAGPGRWLARSFLQGIKWSPFVRDGIRAQDAWDARHRLAAPGKDNLDRSL